VVSATPAVHSRSLGAKDARFLGWRWRAAPSHSGRFDGRGWRNPLAPGGPNAAEAATRKTMVDQVLVGEEYC